VAQFFLTHNVVAIILLGVKSNLSMNNLFKAVTWQPGGKELNLQPPSCESTALTNRPPCHPCGNTTTLNPNTAVIEQTPSHVPQQQVNIYAVHTWHPVAAAGISRKLQLLPCHALTTSNGLILLSRCAGYDQANLSTAYTTWDVTGGVPYTRGVPGVTRPTRVLHIQYITCDCSINQEEYWVWLEHRVVLGVSLTSQTDDTLRDTK